MQCQVCLTAPQQDLMTKCCKLFICQQCKDKHQESGVCICGKGISKKLCIPNSTLFSTLKAFYENQPSECDRCQKNAEIQCRNCKMLFCAQCNSQVHNGKGFAKHIREPYTQKSPRKIIERMKKKNQICPTHIQAYDGVCQCGVMVCQGCIKQHRQSCKSSKIKPIKQYKEQFYSQILLKIKQITEYKQKLGQQKQSYSKHFNDQKDVYENYSKTLDEQLKGLKKILQIKIEEVRQKLKNYWTECQVAYHKNMYLVDYHLKKFDDYARLSEKFVQKVTGLEYLQKRIKKITLAFEFFNFRVNYVDDVQNSILNIASTHKQWEVQQQQIVLTNFQEDKHKEKKIDLLGNIGNNSQFLLECSQNPMNHRPLTLVASHNQVHYEFLHLPYHKQTYQIQYGVGLKMKGQEVFKKIKNSNGSGNITNLNPSTKYRVRMQVCGGQWGPITQIKTQQMPRISLQTHAIKHISEHSLQVYMLNPGVVYGSNQIMFGIHSWQIKIMPMKHNQQQTACISLGVSNKQTKKPVFVGTTLNYGYQKQQITVKLVLNCEDNRLIITSTSSNQDWNYQNLPNFPLYPMLQNKGNHPVQIQYSFL